ncbi:MAG: GspH/FimT family pseudopilin [Acidobacteriota bacterium]
MTTSPARGRASGPGPLSLRRTARPAPPSWRHAGRGQGGFSAVGSLLTLAIIAALLVMAGPAFSHLEQSVSIRSAAGEVGTAMLRARSLAISRGRYVGLKFRPNGDRYEWTIYADGNRNGIRTADITRGIDRPVAAFAWSRNDVLPGILTGTPVPDPGDPTAVLDRPDDPIRFNGSDICSFSPIGESTPGSVYLWDGRDRMAVVRVYNRSAKLRTLYHRRGERSWKP